MPTNVTVFWFRRDLRLEDNTGLFHALETGQPVLPLFIFDKAILDQLDDKTDKRVSFIHRRLEEMNDVLKRFGSLHALLTAGQQKFEGIAGLGDAKYAQLHAVLEMSRRALRETLARGAALSSPQAVRDYLRLRLQGKAHEVFVGVFLDAQNRVLEVEELFRGTLTQTSVFPREIV